MEPWARQIWVTGRTARRTYAITMLLLLAAGWFGHLLAQAIGRAMPWLMPDVATFAYIAQLVLGWLTVTLSARRLHDFGRSGWWQLGVYAVMIGCLALSEPRWADALGVSEFTASLAELAAYLIYLGFLVGLGLIRGDPGPNRFGSGPVGAVFN